MKIRLLNDGYFIGMEAVEFPVEVEAEHFPKDESGAERFGVKLSELTRVGSDTKKFHKGTQFWWWLPGHVEVVE